MTDDRELKMPSSVLRPPSCGIRHFIFWPIFTGGVAFDLWTKNAAFGWLGGLQGQGITIIEGFLRLQLAVNTGGGVRDSRRSSGDTGKRYRR